MKWEELKWPEVERLDKRHLPVVIPLGSVEQHGMHLPLLVDTLQVSAISEAAERGLRAEAVFTPVLWLGSSEHHRDFAGTLSAPPSVYTQIVKSVVRSVLQAGFTRILLLNGHGGNEVPASQALNELIAEDDTADAAHLCFANWWHLAGDEIAAATIGMETQFISHACEYETSLTLYLRPDLVDITSAQEPPPLLQDRWTHTWYGGRVRSFRRWHRTTCSGSMGRPTAASAAKGERLLKAVVRELTSFIRDFAVRRDAPIIKSIRPGTNLRDSTHPIVRPPRAVGQDEVTQ